MSTGEQVADPGETTQTDRLPKVAVVPPTYVGVGVGLALLLVAGRLAAEAAIAGVGVEVNVIVLVLTGMAVSVLGYAAAARTGPLRAAAFGTVAVLGLVLAEVALAPVLLALACMVAVVKGGRRKEVS